MFCVATQITNFLLLKASTSTLVVLLAFGIASIQAGFIDDLYREHNNYRRQNGLSPLRTDSTIEYYLKQLGSVSYAVGHNHDQIPNLEGKLRFSLNVIAAMIFAKITSFVI